MSYGCDLGVLLCALLSVSLSIIPCQAEEGGVQKHMEGTPSNIVEFVRQTTNMTCNIVLERFGAPTFDTVLAPKEKRVPSMRRLIYVYTQKGQELNAKTDTYTWMLFNAEGELVQLIVFDNGKEHKVGLSGTERGIGVGCVSEK